MKRLLSLFWELFKISLFVIGGGYAIIVVADAVFAKLKWTEEGELLDHLPVFQMVPGIIATHTAVYIGRKRAGWRGVAVGVLAVALPSIVIFTFVSAGLGSLPQGNPWLESAFVGLRAALTGVIAATIIRGWKRNLSDVFAYALMLAALAAMICGIAVWIVLLSAMIAGLLSTLRLSPPPSSSTTFRSSSWLALLLFLKYGALCFGGGFVLVPMYLEDFVGADASFLQVTSEEFSNLMALTQMTPGPIGVNGATYFGYRLAGVAGALLASLALLLPGSVLCYAALSSMERFRTSRIVCGILRGAKPASVALMLVALAAFAKMCLLKSDGTFGVIALLLVVATTLMTMKKKLSPMILVLLCTLAATALRADDITCEKYPDADSVVVDEQSRVTYKPDGSYVETCESWSKILTEKGRREESTYTLSYTKRYGNAAIEAVSIIGTNGVERTVDVSGTTSEATDNDSMSANIYDPLDRKIVCTIPGLQVGETLHVKTRHTTFKSRCEGTWADLNVFEWTCPIVRASVEIVAPKERPLKRMAIRHPLGNVTSSTRPGPDGSTVHTFVCTNSPQAFPEPDMPALYTQVQHLLVSTAEDWPEMSRWYWNLCAPHLAKTNAAMVAKVRELTKGEGVTDEERMRAIFKFVSQEVRYMGLTMEDTSPGYEPHDVDVTFDNRYGVCRDKAVLLVAMLRMAGFEAYPVLIHVGPKQDKEVPKPYFNHAIVAVVHPVPAAPSPRGTVTASPPTPKPYTYILMDPTNENAKDLFPAYESDKSYLVARPDGEDLRTTPTPSSDHNALKAATRATLEKDGSLFLESDLRFNGVNDTIYRGAFVKMKPEDRVKFFEKVVKSVAAGAELVRCEVEPRDMRDTDSPVRVSISARLPEMVLRGETRDELTVPFLTKSLGAANFLLRGSTSLEKRRFDLEVDSTAAVDESVDIVLDVSLGAALKLPDPIDIKGGYEFSRSFACKDGLLKARRRVAVAKTTFTPEEYAALREDIKRTEAAERQRPVFSRDVNAEADIHWFEQSSEVDIRSACAWTVTNRISKQVLTYDGKKKSAELKFSYNPRVERLDLVSAVVSNRDGTVTVVTPKEMNVMDCSWAAAAPRYPATKLLVVNLPSVEIGSVITYTVAHTVTNAATSYYGEFGFDAQDPLDRRFVRVGGWMREVKNPKRIPNEPGQPYASLWRDRVIVSSNDFAVAAETLRKADCRRGGLAASDVDEILSSDASLLSIRNWMARHIRIAGPALWELPLDLQLTPPATVLKERYATRLDYIRTLTALLREAGYEADIVYATNDAGDPAELRERIRTGCPNVRAFNLPLCRVSVREGGFLGFFADEKTYYLGTENEYTPLGTTALDGCTYFDPETVSFGTVTTFSLLKRNWTDEKTTIDIRENGAVDMTVETKLYGSGVGAFRKRYAEILPEDRSRLYQSILGGIAQAATATSDLETDIDGYPAVRKFSCFIPDYATMADGAISIQLPALLSSIPTFVGKSRKTPFAVGAQDYEMETVKIVFPEGYTEIEHLPEEFAFAAPDDLNNIWLDSAVSAKVVDGRLEITLTRIVNERIYSWYKPDMIELVKDRSRIAASRANRTIVVRGRARTPAAP